MTIWTYGKTDRPLYRPFKDRWAFIDIKTMPDNVGYKNDPAMPSLSRLEPRKWSWSECLTANLNNSYDPAIEGFIDNPRNNNE